MGIPVAELQERMSFEEFVEWKVFYDMDPFGYQRHDLNTGIILAHIMTALGAKNVKPADFMPKFDNAIPKEDNVKRMAKMFETFMKTNPNVSVKNG